MLKRKNKKDHRKVKAIGSQVSVEIRNELKVQAIREGRKTGEVLGTSEVEIYRYLNGEKMPAGAEDKLKMLWMDLDNPHS